MQSALTYFTPANATKLSRPILFIGFLLGCILSIGVLIGDEAGRVNLLYLLFVYVCIPLLGALLSVISLLQGKGINFARFLSEILPSKSQKAYLQKARQAKMDKPWFFLQSQGAALAYALSSFVIFLLFLISTDMNFVWRSTILEAEQILPLLELVALPWWFLESAQPSIELLRATQDSRLNESYTNVTIFGQWWKFVLATIFVYSFFLRSLLLLGAKVWLKKLARTKGNSTLNTGTTNVTQVLHSNVEKHRKARQQQILAPITHELLPDYVLSNWASLSQNIVSQLNLQPIDILPSGPIIVHLSETKTPYSKSPHVLLVKAWEPPMGELQDYMEHSNGLIYPVNYKKDTIIAPDLTHLEEWQRFTAKIPNWGIYQAKSDGAEKDELGGRHGAKRNAT